MMSTHSYLCGARRLVCQQLLMALAIVATALPGWSQTPAVDDAIPADPPPRWWKGNLHTHTFWSDGNDFPEMVADWYVRHGYNFLALSDHNVLSQGQRWLNVDTAVKRGVPEVVEKYIARFGQTWVERRQHPDSGVPQIRLKPLNEFRGLVESRGRFLMIQGEEISDAVGGKPVHMNASNLRDMLRPVGGASVREAIANNLRAVQEQADKTGRDILLHLNHPNFGYAVTAEDLAWVVQERFFEVYNGHPGVNQLGDATRPSVEKIWDIVNTTRLEQLHAAPLYGLGTDDSHHYHGVQGSRPGRGWVMVRSRHLTPESLIRSLRAGDFYASSGVELEDVRFARGARLLNLKIAAEPGVTYVTEFIGTLHASVAAPDGQRPFEAATASNPGSSDTADETANAEATGDPTDPRVGVVLARVAGTAPAYRLTGNELYVRAVVTSSKPHRDPSFPEQHEQAWTQPVGWPLSLQLQAKEPRP